MPLMAVTASGVAELLEVGRWGVGYVIVLFTELCSHGGRAALGLVHLGLDGARDLCDPIWSHTHPAPRAVRNTGAAWKESCIRSEEFLTRQRLQCAERRSRVEGGSEQCQVKRVHAG